MSAKVLFLSLPYFRLKMSMINIFYFKDLYLIIIGYIFLEIYSFTLNSNMSNKIEKEKLISMFLRNKTLQIFNKFLIASVSDTNKTKCYVSDFF